MADLDGVFGCALGADLVCLGCVLWAGLAGAFGADLGCALGPVFGFAARAFLASSESFRGPNATALGFASFLGFSTSFVLSAS